MRLDDFVAQTLTAIVQGVQHAHTEIEKMGGRINPFRAGSTGAIQVVEFDIEVSTVEGTTTSGGLGVVVGPVAVGTRGQSEATSSSVGRVRFKVPLELPTRMK
jgi:hypothetical protein